VESSQRARRWIWTPRKSVYGEQEKSGYKGPFESSCYHPVLPFNGGETV
jgi:hypothetical protein